MGLRERMEFHFSTRLKDERGRRKWTQEELAKRLVQNGLTGVYASTIAKIETNKRPPQLPEAAAIAELFGMSLDTMLGRKGMEDDQSHAMTVLAEEAQRVIPELAQILERLRRAYQDLEAQFDFPSLEQLVADGVTWTWNLEGMSLEHRRAMLMWGSRDLAMTRLHEAMLGLAGVLAYRAIPSGEIHTAIKDIEARMIAMTEETSIKGGHLPKARDDSDEAEA
jgi:transcriptional regulator with XRE-family HTH domain